MLTRNDISILGIVQYPESGEDPQSTAKRDSTYDATVGTIISAGKTVGASYVLGPRGVVWVVSREQFRVPRKVTAVAALRTTWAHKGIFALNVGVVDPGWNGPVATALVNFSTKDFRVRIGDPFMRLMFFEHGHAVPEGDPKNPPDRETYIEQVKKNSKGFSGSFLKMDSLVDDVSRQIFSLPRWGIRATWAGVIVAVLAVFVPIAVTAFSMLVDDRLSISKMQQRIDQLEKEVVKK